LNQEEDFAIPVNESLQANKVDSVSVSEREKAEACKIKKGWVTAFYGKVNNQLVSCVQLA